MHLSNVHLLSLLSLLILSCSEHKNEEDHFTYSEYVRSKAACSDGFNLLENEQFGEARQKFFSCLELVDFKRSTYARLARCYAGLGQPDSADYFIKKAFRHGHQWKYVDATIFDTVSLKPIYASLHQSYEQGINQPLLNELNHMINMDQKYRTTPYYIYNDSLLDLQHPLDVVNKKKLNAIIDQYGWPGSPVVGTQELPMFDVIAMHSDQHEILTYLHHAREAARKKQASWSDAESIMDMILFRYEKKEGFNKLREVYLDGENNLDIEKSFFQLYRLVQLKEHNPYPFELFPVYFESKPDINPVKPLQEIRQFLINYGLPARLVSIDPEWQQVENDCLGDYMFGFRTMKE